MILRCCQQIEDDLWVIADVSCHHVNIDFESPTCSKRPSGCLIQALPNGLSKVTHSLLLFVFLIYMQVSFYQFIMNIDQFIHEYDQHI